MEGGATTVPAIAASAGLPAEEVLWHIASMRKYGEVREADLEGSYPGYRFVERGGES